MPEMRRTRRAPQSPGTLDRDTRTIEVVAATRSPVTMPGPAPDGSPARWREELVISREAIDLDRFIGGPVLVDHRQATEAIVGVVEAATIVGDELRARIRFATTPRAEEVMQLVADGVLRGVSVGYRVARYERAEGGPPPLWRAVQWAPFEVSFVAVPADAGARVRASDGERRLIAGGEESDVMSGDTKEAAAAPNAAAEDERGVPMPGASQRAGLVVEPRPMPPEHLAYGRFNDDRRLRALAAWEGGSFSPVARGGFGEPDPASPDFLVRAMADGLAARALNREPPEWARQFREARISDLARDLLTSRGERVARYESAASIITRSMLTTSDLPGLLASAFSRTLTLLAPADTPARALTRRREANDFRALESITFSTVPSLEEVGEGGEVEVGAPAERKEVGRLKTFARRIDISLQALLGDDLGALSDAARSFTAAVIDREAKEFARLFAVNGSGWGPTMSDGKPLFHADHGNVATGSLTTGGLAAARAKIRAQTLDGGVPIRAMPRHVLVGPQNETAGEQALSEVALAVSEAERPVFARRLALHVEPRLAGAPWFVFCDPQELPIAEHVVLAGTGGLPQVDRYDAGPERLGVSIRCVHHFAVVPVDWRGAVRMTGT